MTTKLCSFEFRFPILCACACVCVCVSGVDVLVCLRCSAYATTLSLYVLRVFSLEFLFAVRHFGMPKTGYIHFHKCRHISLYPVSHMTIYFRLFYCILYYSQFGKVCSRSFFSFIHSCLSLTLSLFRSLFFSF